MSLSSGEPVVGEVSESLHLWCGAASVGRSVTLSAGIAGRIIASNERWLTFVPFEAGQVSTALSALPGLCLHWTYFEDFGLGLAFWSRGTEVGRFELHWQTQEAAVISFDLEPRLQTLGMSVSLEPLIGLAESVASRSISAATLRDRAAADFGLPAYKWLSPTTVLETPIEAERQRFPEAEDVEEVTETS
jgi:hypothetical protein